MALETLAHEAHHMTEDISARGRDLPRNQRVDANAHATNKAISGAIKGALIYAGIAVAATLLVTFAAPYAAVAMGFEATTLSVGAAFAKSAATLIGLPALGALIKGITGYNQGHKEAEQHNARLEGRSTGQSRGHGHEVEAGVVVAGVPGLAQEQETAWHPAQEQRGSFVERYRPDGPVTGAERIAAMVEAERAARSEQAV